MTTDATPQPEHAAPPKPGVNRVLGATSGSADGNVRAIISVAAVLLFHVAFFALLWAYTHGSPDLKDFLQSTGGALFAADLAAISFYYGKRSGEGA